MSQPYCPQRRLRTLTVAVSISISIAACGTRHGGAAQPRTPNEQVTSAETTTDTCQNHGDCGNTEQCTDGTCTPLDESSRPCTSSSDCAFGLFCQLATSQCVECLSDEHCDNGLVCETDGQCGDGLGCQNNEDCDGMVCDTTIDRCVPCLTDIHCPGGLVCEDQTCVPPQNQGIPCNTQADCDPYGRICEMSTGSCEPCESDRECPDDRVCQNGLCLNPQPTDPTTSCTLDIDCWDLLDVLTGVTEICENGQCTDPQCYNAYDCSQPDGCWAGRCGTCLTDAECRTEEICETISGECITPASPQCLSNADCPTGLVCDGGACTSCTTSSQCNPGNICTQGTCTPELPTETPSTLGQTCSSGDECSGAEVCVADPSGIASFCSRTCIGSGRGGNSDCPSGYACYNFTEGSFDGVSLCMPASRMPATTSDGSPFPGQPFNQAPGASCSIDNHGCQTLLCLTEGSCMRACLANRDCYGDEVCYAAWLDSTTSVSGVVPSDIHYCAISDTANYKAAGQSCQAGYECDSGICTGSCGDGAPCNSADDCSSGVCSGVCRDHCRSDGDCPASNTCDGWPTNIGSMSGWAPTCQPARAAGPFENGASCSQDDHCKSNLCIGGQCTTMCGLTEDCTGDLTGSTCRMLSLVDANDDPVYVAQFCMP